MPANSSLYTLRAAAGHPRLLDQANRVTEKEYPHGREDVMRSSVARIFAIVMLSVALHAQKPRERDLKLPIGGTAGPLDAITDVAGVEVGHTTLISGSG